MGSFMYSWRTSHTGMSHLYLCFSQSRFIPDRMCSHYIAERQAPNELVVTVPRCKNCIGIERLMCVRWYKKRLSK